MFKIIDINNNNFPNLHTLLRLYRDFVIEKMDELEDYTLLRWLNNEGGNISTLPNKGFTDLQEEKSKEKYVNLLTKVLTGIYK